MNDGFWIIDHYMVFHPIEETTILIAVIQRHSAMLGKRTKEYSCAVT